MTEATIILLVVATDEGRIHAHTISFKIPCKFSFEDFSVVDEGIQSGKEFLRSGLIGYWIPIVFSI